MDLSNYTDEELMRIRDGATDEPEAKQPMDLSKYTDEELIRIRDGVADEPVEKQPSGTQQPQPTPGDPDAELKRRLAYVAERGDREDERRQAQNAVNWLNSNASASLGDENAEKMRAYADYLYTGTKERTNDFTKEERRQRYADRYEQAKQLSDMAQFVVDENGDDERYQRDTRQAKNLLNFLTNHTSKFDAMPDYDVAKMTEHMKGMYDAAAGRRGHLRKFWDALMRGHDSLATMMAQGLMMMKPGEITKDDLETIRNLQSERERRDVARPKAIGSVRDIKSGVDVLDYVLEATGENIERMAVTALGATAGAMMGGVPLAIAGASAAGMAMNTGEAVGDQVDEGLATEKNFSRALALGQGFGYSIVDGAFGMTPLLGKVGSGILKSIGRGGAKTAATALREGAKAASVKHAVKEVAKGVVGEAVQEPGQSGVIGRGRRWIQTGSPLREGETPEDAAWEAVDEAAGAFAASLLTGGGTVALNTAGAKRRLAVTDRLANRLIKDEAFNSLSGEHRTLVARHLINDSLLATDTYAPVLTEEDRAALTRQNADIEEDLKADNGKGADNARKMLASITSDYAMEDKATIVEAARKANTLRKIEGEALRATEREIEGLSDSERVFAYYDKNTNQHLYRITDGKDEVWLTTPNPLMKPAADGQTAFATLKEALTAMSENDAYNRARAEHSKSKREVIKQAVQKLYDGEVNLVLADGVGGIADEGLRAEMERGGPDVKAGYSADRNALVVLTDKINSLGELYTTLAHEAKHREIANYLLGKGETVAEGRKRLFGGKANEGAEKFAEHYGTSPEEANEEVAVERASVEDIVKALRDADRDILSAGVMRAFDAVRKIMGFNMGVSERVITDADVRAELRYLWNAGYLGGTQTADAKVTLTEDSEHAVQQGEQERFINDSAARESERQARIREAEAAAQRAETAEAATQTSENAPVAAPSDAAAQTAAPATEGVEAASRVSAEANQESAAPEVPVAERQETQTKENDNEARSVADEEQAKPEQVARSGEQAAEVRQGRVPEAGEVAPAEEGARSAVEEAAEQPPAAKPAVFTEKDGTTETVEGYVAPSDGDLSAGREVVIQHDTGGGINARQKIFGTVKSVDGNRVTVDYEDGWGNPQTVTFDKSEIVGVKPAETSENAPASVPKDAAATVQAEAAKPAEGKETPNAAKPAETPKETPAPAPSATDEAYQAWLKKYLLTDTPKRRRQFATLPDKIKQRFMAKKTETANHVPTADRQGNPVNADGSLKVEAVNDVANLTDEDFTAPTRNVQLPQLPANVDAAIGAEGKPVVIKRNIFVRNHEKHGDVSPEQGREILQTALYSPDLYGQNQKSARPHNWVVISVPQSGANSRLVLLEVNRNKDNVEVVHWHFIDEKGLEKVKKQAAREDGQLLILPSTEAEEAGALSGPTGGSTGESIPQAGAEKQAGTKAKARVKKWLDGEREVELENGYDGPSGRYDVLASMPFELQNELALLDEQSSRLTDEMMDFESAHRRLSRRGARWYWDSDENEARFKEYEEQEKQLEDKANSIWTKYVEENGWELVDDEETGYLRWVQRAKAKPAPAVKKPRKKLPPNKRPGWNTSYNAFAETSDDPFAGEIIGVRKAQGYLLRRPTKDCPLWDWYQNHKDDRSAMLFLFGTAKSGTNDSLETLEDLSFRENLLEQADRQGYDSVADTLLDAYEKYKAWKDNGGVEGAQRAQEERAAYEAEVEQENRFGDDATFEEYALDYMNDSEVAQRIYDEALAEVMREPGAVEMFSRAELSKLREGDILRFDHADSDWIVESYDDAKGELVASANDVADNPLFSDEEKAELMHRRFRITENGWIELNEKEDGNGNQSKTGEGTDETLARDAQGERGEAGGGGESLRLEAATAEELTAEAEKRKQASEIARRQAAPLKGGTGEVGQSLLDLGGAEGEDLFNRTAKQEKPAEPAKPAAPSREASVKAMRTLGMDSALSDAQLRAKMREWQRHAADPRFRARLDAAEVLLADRAAKGKAELTDEDKAMQRILGMRFKRGAESREYEEVVRRYHNADGTAKRGWMKAPNGKPTKLTERQWVQVRTPSFKRWFGDWENDPENASKVVDENGEPLAVYHGSERKFWAFANEKIGSHTDSFGHDGVGVWGRGHYFSDKKDIAESYQRGNPDGQVIDGYLNIRNPMPKEEVLRCGRDAWEFTDSDGKNFYREYQRLIDESLRKNGYDGVVADGKYSTEYVVFAPTQIKSATENTGAFDPQNPDIRYKRGEAAEQKLRTAIGDALKRDTDGHYVGKANSEITFGESVPPVLAMLGAKAERVYSKAYTIRKIVNDHGLTAEQVEGLVDAAEHPAAVLADEGESFVILTDMEAKDLEGNAKPVMIWMRPDGKGNYVASAYSRTPAGERKYVNLVNAGKLLFVDKNKVADLNLGGEAKSSFVSPRASDNVKTPEDLSSFVSADIVAQTGEGAQGGVRFKRSGLYTGSAADYERPSLVHVGTGEGSQVYGWGLYASSVRGVAEGYAKVSPLLTQSLMVPEHAQKNGKNIRRYDPARTSEENLSAETIVGEAIIAAHGDMAKAKEFVESYARQSKERYGDSASPYNKQLLDNARKAVAEIDEHGDEYGYVPQVGRKPSQGYVYEQTFFTDRAPGDESHLLNWYEPVSKEQKVWIEKAIRERFKTVDFHGQEVALPEGKSNASADGVSLDLLLGKGVYAGETVAGASVYSDMKRLLGSPKAASEFLARAGIDGVKYPVDSYGKTLKDGDKAGWNYVSFRDDNITVDHKWRNGKMLFKRGEHEKQTALSGGTSRNQNPAGNEYGKKMGFFRRGTRNIDIGAGRFDKATQFLADLGVENIPFDPVNRDSETNRRAAEGVRENPADTATVHNVLNVIDNDSVMDGIINQAARGIKKNGAAIFTVYEGDRSGNGKATRDGYQRNAKASAYVPHIAKYFGSVEAHGNVILARKPKDVGPAFWAFDSSFDNGIRFKRGDSLAPELRDTLTFQDASEDVAKTAIRGWRAERKVFTNRRSGREAEFKSDWTKIFSEPAKKKSASYAAHYAAANRLDALFENGVKMWDEPPRNGSRDIHAYAKYGCPFELDGETYLAKITVKEYADNAARDGFYSIEAISVEKIDAGGINAGITSVEGHELDPGATAVLKQMLQQTGDIVAQTDDGAQGGVRFKRDWREDTRGIHAVEPTDHTVRGIFGPERLVEEAQKAYDNLPKPYIRKRAAGLTREERKAEFDKRVDSIRERENALREWARNTHIDVLPFKSDHGVDLVSRDTGHGKPWRVSHFSLYDDGYAITAHGLFDTKEDAVVEAEGHGASPYDSSIRFKRGNSPDLPRATEDDPNVAFGTKEGILAKTGIEREFARVSDVAVMKEGERRSRIVGEADGIIRKVQRGDAPSSTDLATLIHAYADRLAELDRARNAGEDTEMLEKAVENVAEGLRLAGNRSGRALQMLKIGVGLSGVRDTYHYLESEVKAIKRKQGLDDKLTESERKMLEAQAAQLKEVNDKLNAELAKVNERNADLETMNRQLMELRRRVTRRIDKAVKERYGIVNEEDANIAVAVFRKYARKPQNALLKRGDGEASLSLNDELRGAFNVALDSVGKDKDNARRFILENGGEELASLFDQYLAESDTTGKTRAGEAVRKRANADSVRGKSRLDRLREATVANLDALGEDADTDAKHRAMAKYLRDFMKYVAKSEPSLTNEEVLSRMADEARLLDPEGEYDAQSMLSVVTGKGGFDMETRAKVNERVKTLEKALALARQGKLTEAAELAGIPYVSDVTLLENYESDLRQQLADDAERLLELTDAPPVGEEARVEEINELKERIKATRAEIAKLRREGNLAEKREAAVKALKERLAAKEAELAELAGKPIADADAAKAEVRSLRRRISALAKEQRVIEALRGQIAEMERRIRENDFEAAPRETQTAEQSPEVKRLIAERQRLRERFAAARRAHQYKQRGVAGQLAKDLWQILGETKGLVGSLDLSSMFRQGGQLTFAHPLIFARNFGKTLNALKSAKNAEALMDEIMSRPNAPYYAKAGIDFTDWGTGAINPDDRFSIYDNDADGRWLLQQFRKVTKNRLVKAGVEASERAFSMYLNLMRADVFDAMIAGSTFGSPANMTQSQLEAVGRHLNVASQRGAIDRNGALGKAVNFLNGFLWSPRNLISRLQFIVETFKLAVPGANPYGDKTLRGMFAKELARYLTGVAAITVFAKTLSDLLRDDDEPEEDIELDPRSSQFLRVKFGETRVEFLSGLAQIITFLSRLGTRQSKTARGQMRDISPTDALGRFLRTKYSPGASLVWDVATRESFSKQDLVFDSLWKSDKDEKAIYRHVAESFVPLTITDVWDQLKYSELKKTAVTTMATLLGAGVNTYDPKTYKQLKGDFTYFRNLYAEADADGRNELMRKCPFLRRTAEIEAAIKAVKEAEKYARQIEKQGGTVGDGLAETILRRRQRVIDLMTSGGKR